MQKLKKIDLISGEKRYLIDYANIKQGLISNQINFLNEKKFRNYFFDISKGFPLVLPFGLECFDYSDVKKVVKIRRKDLFNHIYKLDEDKLIRFLDKQQVLKSKVVQNQTIIQTFY